MEVRQHCWHRKYSDLKAVDMRLSEDEERAVSEMEHRPVCCAPSCAVARHEDSRFVGEYFGVSFGTGR